MTHTRGAAGGGRQRTVRLGGGFQLPESHLLPDAVVAFVDGELSPGAHERAAMHVARCGSCAADVAAQRNVRTMVHESDVPTVPAGLLASLRSIPQDVELPTMPDNLRVTEDGQLVTVQRPERAGMRTPLGTSPLGTSPLGSTTPLGTTPLGSAASFGIGRRTSRRTAHGAGVVVSGLVLSALALVVTAEDAPERPERPAGQNAAVDGEPVPDPDVAKARFGELPQVAPAEAATTAAPLSGR